MRNSMKDRQSDFHQLHFDSIQALRGITALFIVLEHIRFLNCGAFGVDIFFCISGFMIMFSTQRDASFFLRKRLIRILPLYYLMTIGTFLLLVLFPGMFAQTKADPVFLIKSLLFIPFDIGGGVLQPLMRIGWTVNCEIFFYFLFSAALRFSHRFRGLISGSLLLIIVAAASLLPDPPAFLAFYGNPVMLEFLYGMAAYYAARQLYRLYLDDALPGFRKPAAKQKSPGAGFFLSLALLLLCFACLVAAKPSVNILGFRRPLVWGIPAFLIVMCAFLLGLALPKIPRQLVRLGDASFSLYLMHYYPVMFLDRIAFDFSACTPISLFGAVTAVCISILLALISREIMEKRFSGWLRNRYIFSKSS